MCYVTGTEFPHRMIQLEFQDIDDLTYGAISAHTCSHTIIFPKDVFTTYDSFKQSLQAVISSKPTFNMT